MQASAPYSKVVCGTFDLKIQQKLGEIPVWDRVSGGESKAKMDLSREGGGRARS